MSLFIVNRSATQVVATTGLALPHPARICQHRAACVRSGPTIGDIRCYSSFG